MTDTTVKRIDSPGRFEMFAGGGIAAIIIFSVGVFMMVVPVLGWIVGPSLMIAAGLLASAHVFGMFHKPPKYAGNCPHCGLASDAGNPGDLTECSGCGKEFMHRDRQLVKAEGEHIRLWR